MMKPIDERNETHTPRALQARALERARLVTQASDVRQIQIVISGQTRKRIEQSPTFWTIEPPSLRATLVRVLDIRRWLRHEPLLPPAPKSDYLAALSDSAAVAEDMQNARLRMEAEIARLRGDRGDGDGSGATKPEPAGAR